MLNRILVAIDQFDDSGALVAAAGELSRGGHTAVRVVHCLEFIGPGCAAPVLSTAEAELLVECAVFQLRSDGIPSDGLVRRADNGSVHRLIAGTAAEWGADLVLLGSSQRRGLGRLRGHGVRERLIRLSPVPVLVAPVDRRRPAHRFAHH